MDFTLAVRSFKEGLQEVYYEKSSKLPFSQHFHLPFQVRYDKSRPLPFVIEKTPFYETVCRDNELFLLLPQVLPQSPNYSLATSMIYEGQKATGHIPVSEEELTEFCQKETGGLSHNDGKLGWFSSFHYLPYEEKTMALTVPQVLELKKFL